jgi:hypothetical protein
MPLHRREHPDLSVFTARYRMQVETCYDTGLPCMYYCPSTDPQHYPYTASATHAYKNMAYDAQVLLPTLIGSILSCIACIFVLISYIIYADQQRSFRHALVLNLALAGKTLFETT